MMKKVILSLTWALGFWTIALGQTDPKAKQILGEVSKKYAAYSVIKANFVYSVSDPQNNTAATKQGTLFVKPKVNKYKIVFADQELISDGTTQWSFLKEDKEVQVSTAETGSGGLNPAKIFTIYEKGYKYLYAGDARSNGRPCYLIDLTPTDAKNSIFKVRLSIDKTTKLISNAQIFDKNGNRISYTIKQFTPNVKLSDSFFTYSSKEHPGVELVDLR